MEKVKKIDDYEELIKKACNLGPTTVFLGGTCGDSTWRSELIPMLNSKTVKFFNPQLGPGEWNDEAAAAEKLHRELDDICVYVITPEGEGFYSFVEVTDDSNKRPERTVLLVLMEAGGKRFEGHTKKCVEKTMQLVAENGATVVRSLEELAEYLNGFQSKKVQEALKKIRDYLQNLNDQKNIMKYKTKKV